MKRWKRLETRRENHERLEHEKAALADRAEQARLTEKERQADWKRYDVLWEARHYSPETYQEYENEFRRIGLRNGSSEADIVFNLNLMRFKERLPADWEPLVEYLERDEYRPFSGYAKESAIRFLKGCDLPASVLERLRQIVLMVVDKYHRREFRYYCQLAWKADSPALREALAKRLPSKDTGIARRARWVLEYLASREISG